MSKPSSPDAWKPYTDSVPKRVVAESRTTPSAPISCGTLTGGAEGTLVGTPRAEPSRLKTPPAGDRLAPPVFVSSEPWREKRIGAVAVYCSDGRWGDAIDEFCHRGLGIPAYDRFAVPGGPAWIVQGAPGRAALLSAARGQLEFLVKAHALERIILITHWGCAFYGHALGCGPEQCLGPQLEDVARAADAMRDWFGSIQVEGYLAGRDETALTFRHVPV